MNQNGQVRIPSPNEGGATAPDIDTSGQRPDPDYFRRFPIFVIALALCWVGLAAPLDQWWAVNAGLGLGLVGPLMATVFFGLGAALILSRSHGSAARALALLVAAIGGFAPWFAPASAVSLYGHSLGQFWPWIYSLLAVAVYAATGNDTWRYAARVMCGFVVCWAVFYGSLIAFSGDALLIDYVTDVLYLVLALLASASIVSLSHRHDQELVYAERGPFLVALVGALVAASCWYGVTEEGRYATRVAARAIIEPAGRSVVKSMNRQVALFNFMASRVESAGTASAQVVRNFLSNAQLQKGAFLAVAAIDPEGGVHWLSVTDPSLRRLLLDQLDTPGLQRWMGQVSAQPARTFVGAASLIGGIRPWNIMGKAVQLQGHTWLLVAVADSQQVVAAELQSLPQIIGVRLHEHGLSLFDSMPSRSADALGGGLQLPVSDDVQWTLQWRLPAGTQSLLARILPLMLFLGGLIFSVLLSRSLKFSLVLRAHTQQLEHRALHDALTRLPNKKLLGRRLQAFFTRLHEREGVLWVVALDLNGLKMINDSMGHTVGDRVLKLVAGRIQAISGSASMVARLEGDEFVLVFLDVSNTDVSDTVQRVMAEVARPYEIDGMELRVTASAGVTATRRGVSDPMELVREAELAMAWAKRDGGNTLHLYSPELSVPVQERLALRTELQHALEHEQFELHYQPIVDVRGGAIVGAEALLRWPHPVRGVISPRHFIALAEETGQIVPLSNWVLDTACRDISILKERNHASFPVVVNVSPLHFRRADFVDVLQRALARHNLPEGSLDLEITEGMVVDHTEDALDKLNRIRELGVRVSIDDFGTGYSSLNYLKNLPIDKIKIDQSFVRDVISDRRDAAITKAIIGLAHHLNLKVVAEGVETESQFWFLKRNFCDEVQGYLFQRPVPFSDFSQILFEQGGRVSMPVARIPVESDKVLLLLDDEPNILRALTRLLRRDGYRILTATTPQQAFTLLAENNVQVVMSDQRMPEMTGTEFFSQVKELYPETIRLVLSGYTDLKSVTDAINRGAIYRFLTKPWDDEDLRREIAEAFKGYHSQDMHA